MSEAAPASLGTRAARGAIVTMGGQGFRMVVQVLSVVILARLLTPADYGLLAMTVALVGVAEIFRDFGLSTAAIQAKVLTDEERSNLFWINTGIGLVLALAVFALAPVIALVYGQDELVDLTRVLAWAFVLNGMATQYRADLNRRLKFVGLAVADSLAPLLALAVGVAFALLDFGYWALTAQQMSQVVFMLAVVVPVAGWLPGRPHRRVPMRRFLRFGWNMVGTQLISYAGNNVSAIVIGTRYGVGELGLYNRAYQLLMTPLNQFRAPTTTVALPVLAKLQDDERFDRFVQRGQLALGYTLVCVLGVVVGASEPVTTVFLGDRWGGVEPVLRLLAVAGIFQTLAYVGYWVYLAKGLVRDLFQYTWITVTIRVTLVLVGSHWGVVGVAAGFALSPAIAWPLSFWWLSRRAAVDVRYLFAGAARILVVATSVGVAAWVVSWSLADRPAAVALVASVGTAAAVYAGVVLAVPMLRRDVLAVVATLRSALARRRA